jgi:hypothetical protein
MKSSLQVKWYGIVKLTTKTTQVGRLPKSLLKGTFSVSHWGGVILTHSKRDAAIIKNNVSKRGINDLISFEITDKQFGMINITYNKPATLPAPFKNGLVVKDGDRNIAIPVTLKQSQADWLNTFVNNV